MKTEDTKHFVCSISRITAIVIMLLCVVFTVSGCVALSFLLSSGPYEKKIPPAYDLKAQQDRKVFVWVECPRSANADFDVQDKLITAFQLYLTEKAGFNAGNIILNSSVSNKSLLLDPKKVARSQGAGYLLLVQVDKYEADFLQVREYFAGELVTRAVLFDVHSGQTLWPNQPEGKMIHIAVEMETEGRNALVSRLTSATAHCILRYLYPCEKLKFKTADERVSLQEAYEMETY
ncbi:MAG: hypothetical protein DRP52_02570 [Planctomycetota bacterium]|nr:MAG: hypothetical protein DRP52_02570 [Planctomycetota bacterium]